MRAAMLAVLIQAQAPACGPYGDYLKMLADKFHEQPIAHALSKTGVAITVTASAGGDTYTVLATKPDVAQTTCLMGEGRDWQAVTPPAAGDPT